MGHLKIGFTEILDVNIVIQDSIFNSTELFFIMFKKMADCLLRPPVRLMSLLLMWAFSVHCLCCTFPIQFRFSLPAVSPSMRGSVLEGRPRWSFYKFREVWLRRQLLTLCCMGPLPSSAVGLIDSPTLPSFSCIFRFPYCSFQCILISCLAYRGTC